MLRRHRAMGAIDLGERHGVAQHHHRVKNSLEDVVTLGNDDVVFSVIAALLLEKLAEMREHLETTYLHPFKNLIDDRLNWLTTALFILSRNLRITGRFREHVDAMLAV